MPGDTFNPVAEVRKRYPALASWDDARIISNLSDPERFRSAFPEYGNLPDEMITRNMARYGQGGSASTVPPLVRNLMASHKTTQFQQPTYTAGSIAREGALGFASGAGIPETQSPVLDLASNLVGNKLADESRRTIAAGQSVKGYTQAALSGVPILGPLVSGALFGGDQLADEARQSFAAGGLQNNVRGTMQAIYSGIPILGPATYTAGQEIRQGIDQRDPNLAAHGIGSGAGLVTSLALGTEKGSAAVDATLGKVTDAVRANVADPLAARMANSAIGSRVQDFSFGKNPGQAVAEMGVVAGSRGGLLDKLNAAKAGGEARIDAVLQNHPNATPSLNVTQAVNGPIDAAIHKAVNSPAMPGRQAFIDELEQLRSEIGQQYQMGPNGQLQPIGTRNLTGLTPYEANQLKRAIGDATQWTPEHLKGQNWEAVTAVKRQIYGNLKDVVNTAVPEVAPMNEQTANLMAASRALEHRIRLTQKNTLTFGDLVAGSTGGITAMATGHPEALLLPIARRVVESTPFKTGTAALLTSHSPTLPTATPAVLSRAAATSSSTSPNLSHAVQGAVLQRLITNHASIQ